jgi:hypothetical protein
MSHLDAVQEQGIAGALAFRQSWPQLLRRTVFVHHALVRQLIRKLTLLLERKVWKNFKNL